MKICKERTYKKILLFLRFDSIKNVLFVSSLRDKYKKCLNFSTKVPTI